MKRPILKVAKSGFDIRTANPKDLTIDSTKNQSKILLTGEGSATLNSGNSYSVSVVIDHNLGYQPAFIGWARIVGVTNWRLMTLFEAEYTEEWYADRVTVATFRRISVNRIALGFYEDPYVLSENPYANRTIEYCYELFTDPEEGAWYE